MKKTSEYYDHWNAEHIEIEFTLFILLKGSDHLTPKLRRIGYRDLETKQYYEFLTNNFNLSAKTIAAIYKEHWQVELFFKWIKQNLKIKAFVGNSKNAIMTQIWIALCTCLMLAYIKFSAKLEWCLQKIIRILQLNLFMRRDLLSLLRDEPPKQAPARTN